MGFLEMACRCVLGYYNFQPIIASLLKQESPKPRTAWFCVDPEDADPVRFMRYLVASIATVEEVVGQRLLPLLYGMRVPILNDLITLLLNELGDISAPITLVLDDYHLIKNAEIDSALALLVDRIPQQVRLVMITREQPDLPLSRWRPLQYVAEFALSDLRFTSD